MRPLIVGLLALAAAGASVGALAREPAVGTGWSRAPDLSVYGAMRRASSLAREQDILCAGLNPAFAEDRWRAAYGVREAWVAGALARRYGSAAVAGAEYQRPLGRLTCPTVSSNRWHRSHAKLLRLLEYRLIPSDHFRRPAR